MMFVITTIAIIALVVFIIAMIPYFHLNHLFDIPVTKAAGASTFLPFGYLGIGAAIPYAMWFFLAVEGIALAAEETRNPQQDLPRGFIGAIIILFVLAALILITGAGGSGSSILMTAKNPLVAALNKAYGHQTWITHFVNFVGLAGLIASFFSIIYAYSRQIFALSRAGYLPRVLSLTNKRKAPTLALCIPGLIGFVLSLTGQGDLLILIAVFGATLSYLFMMASHIALRLNKPNLTQSYRTPGGIFTSGTALLLSVIALTACFLVNFNALIGVAVVYLLFIAYFYFYSRHHLVSGTPEQECADLLKLLA